MIPIEPGYYWALPLNKYISREPIVVKVVNVQKGDNLVLRVRQFGLIGYFELADFEQWQGPIVRPN